MQRLPRNSHNFNLKKRSINQHVEELIATCMYSELNGSTHIEGSQDTSWRGLFKLQEGTISLAQDDFVQKQSADGREQQFFMENINHEQHGTSQSPSAEVSQTRSTATASATLEPSSDQMPNNHLEPDGMNQIFDAESMNAFKRHGRAILTVAQVQAIFRYKSTSFAKDSEKAGALARMYGVCVKTVRDIWGGRTWYRATFHLDQSKPFTPERLQKKAGRPKGAKDRKPRARKITFDDSCVDELYYNTESKCDLPSPCDGAKPGAKADDWTDFPTGINTAGFEDPFEEDWIQWLQEDREGLWANGSTAASDDDD